MDIITELNSLKQHHYECEDCWYSCPKSDNYCNANKETECNCGADYYNSKIDKIIEYIKFKENKWI